MKRRLGIQTLAIGLATVLALSACSDPTNPATPSSTTPAGDTAANSAGGAAPTDSGSVAPSGGAGSVEPSGSGGAAPSGTINVFQYQKPTGIFDPIAAPSGPDQQVISLIFESLMVTSPEGKLTPALIDGEPKLSDDAKTITYTLKKGLMWSDGKPLTSADVLFTFNRAADPKTTGGYSSYLTGVAGVKEFVDGKAKTISGFAAPDEQTFTITSALPDTGLLGRISTLGIIPEHALKDLPIQDFAKNPWFQKPAVTSGPFTFVEYKTDQFEHLTANPKFREPVGVKDVYLKPVTSDVATQQLGSGEMDIASISPNDAAAVEGFKTVNVVEAKSFGFVRAAWNQEQPRFKDPKVKQAFLYAVNRAGIVEAALQGKGLVRNDVFDPLWSGDGLEQYAFDQNKAKALLKEANWDSSKPVKLSWIPGSNPDRDAAATVLQDQLNQVGIKLELNQVQASFFEPAYKNHTYDMVLYGGGDYATEPSNVGPITNCDKGVPVGPNVGLYCNKDLDALMAKASETVDKDKRATLFKEAAKIENADPSQMWLFSPNTVYGVSKKVQGYQPGDIARYYEPWKWTVTG